MAGLVPLACHTIAFYSPLIFVLLMLFFSMIRIINASVQLIVWEKY